jgi:transcriptional regulator with XRE-family HTH domain
MAGRLVELIGSHSVSSFARKTGLSDPLMRKYLNGALPNTGNLVQIADACGVSVDWLAAGLPPKFCPFDLSGCVDSSDQSQGEDELELLGRFREIDNGAKVAIQMFLEAIERPSATAWWKASEAIGQGRAVAPATKPKGDKL